MKRTFRPSDVLDAAVLPIFTTSTFSAPTAQELKRRFEVLTGKRKPTGHEHCMYARFGTPNSLAAEAQLVQLERGAQAALLFPSGMSAITKTVVAHTKPGDVILYTVPVYGCTETFFSQECPQELNRRAIPVDTSHLKSVERALRAYRGSVAMVFIETPANPTLRLSDIKAICDLVAARQRGRRILTVVDNTFMGPCFQHPLSLGADIAVYSCTKFIGGHSDLTAGAVLTRDPKLIIPIKSKRDVWGPTIAPFTCWQISRSVEELPLRMNAQANGANLVARFLAQHPKVGRVFYPGLMGTPDQDFIYESQCDSGGSMVSFALRKGGEAACFRLLNRLRVFTLAVSLGSTESLAVHPRSTTHLAVSPKLLEAAGVTNSLIRLSIGIENPDELIHDLKRALKAA